MIDPTWLANNKELAVQSQKARGQGIEIIDKILDASTKRKSIIKQSDDKRAEHKNLTKTIGRAKDQEERNQLLAQAQNLSQEVKDLETEEEKLKSEYESLSMMIPNIIEPGVPSGGEDDFEVIKEVGTPKNAEYLNGKDHLDIGTDLDIIDTARGVKVSGSRFYFLKGAGATIEFALVQLGLKLGRENGFEPIITPTLVNPKTMSGTGFLGAHSDEIYHLEKDDLYLVGTSEVPMAGYYADEIIDLNSGSKRFLGFSTCYRREAGSYGKDTRGIIRVHQFNKLEMFSYCTPDIANEEHLRFLELEEKMLQAIEVPYRVIHTAAGDLGDSAARKYDCEAWVPSQQKYRELTSTSNCTTFQARRLGIRYTKNAGEKPQIAATINGTLATTRWIVAILENHYQPDGSVILPKALQEITGLEKITKGLKWN